MYTILDKEIYDIHGNEIFEEELYYPVRLKMETHFGYDAIEEDVLIAYGAGDIETAEDMLIDWYRKEEEEEEEETIKIIFRETDEAGNMTTLRDKLIRVDVYRGGEWIPYTYYNTCSREICEINPMGTLPETVREFYSMAARTARADEKIRLLYCDPDYSWEWHEIYGGDIDSARVGGVIDECPVIWYYLDSGDITDGDYYLPDMIVAAHYMNNDDDKDESGVVIYGVEVWKNNGGCEDYYKYDRDDVAHMYREMTEKGII